MELLFEWEVTAYNWRYRVIGTGRGLTLKDAKLDLVRDLTKDMADQVKAVKAERVLVGAQWESSQHAESTLER